MDSNTTKDLCEAISVYWTSQQDLEAVQNYGLLLKKASDDEGHLTLQTAQPSDIGLIPKDDFGRYVIPRIKKKS